METCRTGTVLIVDDSLAMRRMLRKALAPLALDIVEAADGIGGLKLALQREFDVVIVDFNMPNLNGLAMTEQLRSSPRYRNTPIFMVTSTCDQTTVERGCRLAVTAWFYKPVDAALLRAKTVRALDQSLPPIASGSPEYPGARGPAGALEEPKLGTK